MGLKPDMSDNISEKEYSLFSWQSFLIGGILLIAIGVILFLFLNGLEEIQEKSNSRIEQGKTLELEHLVQVQIAKSCGEKNLLLIKYFSGNDFWDKRIRDQAFTEYENKCMINESSNISVKESD